MKPIEKQRIIPAFKQYDLEGPKPRVNEFLFALQIFNLMNFKGILLFFTLAPLLSFGQFSEKKVYHIEKVQNAPKIDGDLNDNVWAKIDIANNFSQISPNNGTPEKNHQRTEVKICYDSKNIYFGVMMYDNAPDSILKELAIRDNNNAKNNFFLLFYLKFHLPALFF